MAQQKFQRPVRRGAARVSKASRLEPYLQMAPSLLQALIVAVVGYFITDRVDQALKERQATVASVTAMTTLLQGITHEAVESRRLAMVRELAMYGVDAIDPLVNLALSTEIPVGLPAQGLALIAIGHQEQVCAALGRLPKLTSVFPDARRQIDYLEKHATQLGCEKKRRPCTTR